MAENTENYNVDAEPLLDFPACQRIATAWSHAISIGRSSVTVDARGFPPPVGNTENCSASPIPTSNPYGRLLLGNYTFYSHAPWVIPSGVEIVGLGVSGPTTSSGPNTTISPSSSFSNSDGTNALIEIGIPSSNNFDAKLRGVTVDCAGSSNCKTGVLNIAGNDNARIEEVAINNASSFGLEIIIAAGPLGGQDSGSYRDITVQYPSCAACSASTVGVEIDGNDAGTIVRGLDTVKVSAWRPDLTACGFNANYGIHVSGAALKISNSNVECAKTGVQIDASSGVAHNVQIDNSFFRCDSTHIATCTSSDTTTAGVGVKIAVGGANVTITNETAELTSGVGAVAKLIQYTDLAGAQKALSGPFQGFFTFGDPNILSGCSPAANCLALISSDPSVKWLVPGGAIN